MQEGPLISRSPSDELPIKKFTLIEINHLLTIIDSRLTPSPKFLEVFEEEMDPHSLNDFLSIVRPYLGAVNDSEMDQLFLVMEQFENTRKSDEIDKTLVHILKIGFKQGELFNTADARLVGILQLLLNDLKTLIRKSPALNSRRDPVKTYESKVQRTYLNFMGHLKQIGYLQEMRAIHLFFSSLRKICLSTEQVLSGSRILKIGEFISASFLKAFLFENRLIPYNEKRENTFAEEIMSSILKIDLLELEYVNAGYPTLDPQREEILNAAIKPFRDFIPTSLLEKTQTPLKCHSEDAISTTASSKRKMHQSRNLISQNSFPPPRSSSLLYNPSYRSRSASTPQSVEIGAAKNSKNTP